MLKALLIALLQGLLAVLSPALFFTPAYIFRGLAYPGSFWWIWLNDENLWGNYEECWSIVWKKNPPRSLEEMTAWMRFRAAYYFSGIRNYAWNLLSSNIFLRSIYKVRAITGWGKIYHYDASGNFTGKEEGGLTTMKRFKFRNDATGNSTNGTGKIDYSRSIIGYSYARWYQGTKRYALFSMAMFIFRTKCRVWMVELNIGMASRWLVRFKIQTRKR